MIGNIQKFHIEHHYMFYYLLNQALSLLLWLLHISYITAAIAVHRVSLLKILSSILTNHYNYAQHVCLA